MWQKQIKIKSVDQIIQMLNTGSNIVKNQTKYLVMGTTERGYIPANLREELFRRYPILDPDYVDTSGQLILKPPPKVEEPIELEPEPLPPSFPLAPEEYILHELPLRVIESIAILERLHHTDDENKHELSFSQSQTKEFKFNDKNKTTAHSLLSLADVTIYYLIDCYHLFQGMDGEVSRLELELTDLYRTNRQLQQKCILYESALIQKTLMVM